MFIATAVVIEIIHWPEVVMGRKGMLTVDFSQDRRSKKTHPCAICMHWEIPGSVTCHNTYLERIQFLF